MMICSQAEKDLGGVLVIRRQPAFMGDDQIVTQRNNIVNGELALEMGIHQSGLINLVFGA